MAGPSKLTQWEHLVLDCDALTATEKAVAWAIKRYMHRATLKAYPSFATLARCASVSEQTVRRAVRRLAVLGLIDHTPGQYTGTASTYTGRLEGINEAERAYQPRTKRVSTRPKEPITGDTPTWEDLSEHVRTGPDATRPSGAVAPPGACSGPSTQGQDGPASSGSAAGGTGGAGLKQAFAALKNLDYGDPRALKPLRVVREAIAAKLGTEGDCTFRDGVTRSGRLSQTDARIAYLESTAAIAALPDYVAEVDRLRAWCSYYQDHNAYETDWGRLIAGEWPEGSR